MKIPITHGEILLEEYLKPMGISQNAIGLPHPLWYFRFLRVSHFCLANADMSALCAGTTASLAKYGGSSTIGALKRSVRPSDPGEARGLSREALLAVRLKEKKMNH